MKVNNIEVINIYKLLQSISTGIEDISLRWELANYCEPLINAVRLFEFEVQKIKDKESSDINKQSENYTKLLNCSTNIDIDKLSLFDLELLHITEMSDLLILKPIVDSKKKQRTLQ